MKKFRVITRTLEIGGRMFDIVADSGDAVGFKVKVGDESARLIRLDPDEARELGRALDDAADDVEDFRKDSNPEQEGAQP